MNTLSIFEITLLFPDAVKVNSWNGVKVAQRRLKKIKDIYRKVKVKLASVLK